ncbi:hypothetical protein ACFWYW_56050 [Nonomuraea sp. NPDC059023]|uniref:hypothetical protein n=1 Tax=unclassified Nonomuraea TaxID=2593643 RepID=UPI00367CAE89
MQVIVLRQLAEERDLVHYGRFARLFERTAREVGYRDLTISDRQWDRWLSGRLKGLPHPRAREVLGHIFGRPAAELFSLLTDIDTVAPVCVDAASILRGTPVEDRARGLYELMMEAADRSREAAGDAELTLGGAAMEQLQDDVIRLARTFLQSPPMVLFPELVDVRDQIAARRSQTRKPAQLGELNFMSSVVAALLAEACIDLGETKMARDHARAAWSFANSIDHVPLAVHARGLMASSSYWAGHPQDAVIAITRAVEQRPVGLAAARVQSIAARAWSHVGDADKTVQAIRAATEARANDQGGDELQAIGGVFLWDEVRQHRCFSTALLQLLHLRDGAFEPTAVRRFTGQVLTHTQQALDMAKALPQDERSQMVEATIGIEMATAFVLLGDLTNARGCLGGALQLPADMRSFPVLQRLGGLRVRLATLSERAARDLGDDLAMFVQGSTVRALPAGS